MGIQGIGDYNSTVQNYMVPSIPHVSVEEVRRQDEAAELQTVSEMKPHENTPIQGPRQDAPLEDISITFNKQQDYGYLGKDSDIHSLDMERAISDMQKDQVLQQYQYFVGNSRNLFADNADGVVVPKL